MDLCPSVPSGFPADLYLTLLNALMISKCKLNLQDKYPEDFGPKINDGDEFDFIVIGSGSAGSVIGHELAKNPNWKVLVLEAGGVPSITSEIPALFFNIQLTDEDWQYTIEKDPNACLGVIEEKCRWPRGKLLGGCSSINAMVYIRGSKKDYEQWGQIAEGWDYESVVPHFKMLENYQDPTNEGYFGTDGLYPLQNYQSDEPIEEILFAAAKELGIPSYSREHEIGYFRTLFGANGTRQNTAKVFLTQNQQNLKVSHHSFVEKLLIDPSSKTVTGVLVKIGDRKVTLKAGKEVIVSAGAINTPQILMLSGIGPKQHLESLKIPTIADLPVGQNLQDHLIFWGLILKVDDSAKKPTVQEDELYNYFMHQKGELSKIGLFTSVGFINTKKDSPYANMQFHHYIAPKNDFNALTMFKVVGLKEEIVKAWTSFNQNYTLFHVGPTLINPKSTGEILLKSNNPYDKPLIYANYFKNPQDFQIMLEGIRFVETLIETNSFKNLKPEVVDFGLRSCQEYEFRSDDYWICYLKHISSTLYHPVGTCSLGTVVDSRLRVKGINNLRVADASIMPTITSGNTNAPSMMIGRKGAAMILQDWEIKHNEL